jgi:hypothetical protein
MIVRCAAAPDVNQRGVRTLIDVVNHDNSQIGGSHLGAYSHMHFVTLHQLGYNTRWRSV